MAVGSKRHIGIAKQGTDVLNPLFMANTWCVELMIKHPPVCSCWSSFDTPVLVWPRPSPPAVTPCLLAPCGEGDEAKAAGKQAGQQRGVQRRIWFENNMARVSPNVRSCCHALAQAGRDSLIQKSSIRTQLASERISPERVNHHRRLSACRSVGRPDGLSLALPHTPGRGPRAATMEGPALAARERPQTLPCLLPELGVAYTSRGRCDALSAPSAKPVESVPALRREVEKKKGEDRRGKRRL